VSVAGSAESKPHKIKKRVVVPKCRGVVGQAVLNQGHIKLRKGCGAEMPWGGGAGSAESRPHKIKKRVVMPKCRGVVGQAVRPAGRQAEIGMRPCDV